MHVNKVHHITTITRVAQDLGEDEDWLRDVANEMEIEDGPSGSMASAKMVFWPSPTSESRTWSNSSGSTSNTRSCSAADPPAAYAGWIR
jgi:hypothetical protein